MMQRASTETGGGDVGAHHDVDLPAAPTGEVNDNYAPKSASQMDDNNEQQRSRGTERQRGTTTTPATRLEEQRQLHGGEDSNTCERIINSEGKNAIENLATTGKNSCR